MESATCPGAPQYFVQVVEIWEPARNSTELQIRDAYYGGCEAFGAASEGVRFRRGVGLPGRVWESGRPVVLDGLVGSNFERVVIAGEAGLGAGLAIPVVAAGRFRAALVLLFAVCPESNGVAEVWTRESRQERLALDTSFHGDLAEFARDSQRIRFEYGQGLPGLCWQIGTPVLVRDVRHWPEFQRRLPAEAERVTTGVGIPIFQDNQLQDVVTMFGTVGLDLVRRAQVWDAGEGSPRLSASVDAPPPEVPAPAERDNLELARRCAEDGLPQLGPTAKGAAFAFPVLFRDQPRSVITFDL